MVRFDGIWFVTGAIVAPTGFGSGVQNDDVSSFPSDAGTNVEGDTSVARSNQ